VTTGGAMSNAGVVAGPESAAALPPPLPAGYAIAPGYEVLEHLNRGAALDVYEVFSTERMCSCVAKVVRPDRLGVPRVVRRLINEGEALRSLAHPHVVRLLDMRAGPEPLVILETLTGPPLDYLIYQRARRPSATDIAQLGVHLCSAVHYLHGRGYLHLDIRPDNVIVECGVAKLVDLSLARPPGRSSPGIGTRDYLAPEQATGGELSAATDVWGLGATLYEAAAGIPPFAPVDEAEAAIFDGDGYLQLRRGAFPLARWRRRLPAQFTAVVEQTLVTDPRARPTVLELLRVLDELANPPAG
jgi:serine/threonine protein kinase